MRKTTPQRKTSVALACLAVMLTAGAWRVVGANGRDDARARTDLRVIGLTDDNRLVSFRATSPERTRQIGYISGLNGADTALVGIDFRVQDGKLYGVGNGGGVYTLDPSNAQATLVNTLTVPLVGTALASTSTRLPTGCGSSAIPVRTSRTT